MKKTLSMVKAFRTEDNTTPIVLMGYYNPIYIYPVDRFIADAVDAGVDKVVHTSTSEVYGDPQVHPQPESYWGHVNPHGIRACYDEGKRAAEMLFYEYGIHRGIETRIARIFNTYGPRMQPDDGRVVSSFIVQALRGEPPQLAAVHVEDRHDRVHAARAGPGRRFGCVRLCWRLWRT
mgnify:CR=1 FL=1